MGGLGKANWVLALPTYVTKEQGAQATVADKPFQATEKNTTVALID